MRLPVTSLIVILYGLLAVVVAGLFLFLASSNRANAKLLAELEKLELRGQNSAISSRPKSQYESMRPSLMRLQTALEERSKRLRDQQSQMQQQVSQHTELQQRYEELTKEHAELERDHRLLLNEVDFYLAAIQLAMEDNSRTSDPTEATEQLAALTSGDVSLVGLNSNSEATNEDSTAEEFDTWLAEQTRQTASPDQQSGSPLSESQPTSSIAAAATNALIDSGDEAVPVLGTLLTDRDPSVRAWAAWTLGNMGDVAAPALPLLRSLIEDEDEEVARAAENAIERIVLP